MDIRRQIRRFRAGREVILQNLLWAILSALLILFATSVCLSPLLLVKP